VSESFQVLLLSNLELGVELSFIIHVHSVVLVVTHVFPDAFMWIVPLGDGDDWAALSVLVGGNLESWDDISLFSAVLWNIVIDNITSGLIWIIHSLLRDGELDSRASLNLGVVDQLDVEFSGDDSISIVCVSFDGCAHLELDLVFSAIVEV
jgi:hypothetical protein